MAAYVPDRGDIVWLRFDTRAGHEQAGRRTALVLSPRTYNQKVGLALFCPITSNVKGYPFEVLLASQSRSAVLADDMKNLDWRARKATRKRKTSDAELAEVRGKLRALLG